MQHKITTPGPLLTQQGHLAQAGWDTSLRLTYRRRDVRANPLRLKEWDYYLVSNGRYAVALTIADNGYMGLDSVSLLDLEHGWETTTSPMRILPLGRTGLPETSEQGNVYAEGKGYQILFENDGTIRRLTFHMDRFRGDLPIDGSITLTDPPRDSMVIATPFPNAPKAFYYNQKINCLRASGEVTFDGTVYRFSPEDAFGVLDWGRGVWTYDNTWYWSSASGMLEGETFGFNLGYGFGDTSAATENMLFYGGRAHKLQQVLFHIPKKNGKDDYMSPWHFDSSDGRFACVFMPELDRASCTKVGPLCSDQHQVFGRFSGTATLDDGRILRLHRFPGFAEKVRNKW